VLLVVTTDQGRLVQFDALATAWLVLFWWLLAPPSGRPKAVTLATVNGATYRRLVRAETHRRAMELSAHDTYRSARVKLREGALTIGQYRQQQQQLDDAASTMTHRIAGVSVEDALATTGAATPVASARAAVLCALPLAVIVVGYEWWTLLTSDLLTVVDATPLQLVAVIVHTMRWLAYAAVFGLFYPLLRGRNPIRKASTLMLLVLPAELLSVLSSINPSTSGSTGITTLPQMFLALAIRAGQVVVFCLSLGLAWERWLAARAGYRWYRLRNVRSIRALAAPLGTVLVAAATAFATAIAGAAVVALLSTGSGAKTPGPSPSSSSTPARNP
jgi:hypothetical protein